MRVNRLVLRSFRNYQDLTIDFKGNVHIFVGDNAQGKTNILEAIYFGAIARSHRTNDDNDLIRWEDEKASIDLYFSRQGVENKLGFRLAQNTRKEILFNEYPIKPREVIGSFNTVLFSPEDLLLIKGAPALRRRFLDIEISQAVPLYYRQLLQYSRLLNQRNSLLKKIREKKAAAELLDSWDEQLTRTAVFIVEKRLEALRKIGMLANLMHRKLTKSRENLAMAYSRAGASAESTENLYEWYMKSLKIFRESDIIRGSTCVGPHRDDIILTVNSRDLRNFGSQGQQRTGILAMKLAELEFLKSETGEYPVLLLDDVMSELDSERREQLVAFIRDKIQTFITATDEALFPKTKMGKFYRISSGKITE